MEPTKLLYLEDHGLVASSATTQGVLEEDGKQVVVLNQTGFYPQGGGQSYDTGEIKSS